MPIQQYARKPALALGATAMIIFGASGITAAASASKQSTTSSVQRGHGGGPGLDTAALASALGVTTAQLETAIKAAKTEGTTTDPATERAAEAKAIADALGVSQSTVETVLTAQAPAGRGGAKPTGTKPTGTTPTPSATTPTGTTPGAGGPGRGARGAGRDQTQLIAALVKATGKTEAEVKAAITKGDAVRDAARKAAAADFAKRLAAELGLDQAKVATAIDASRSARPASPANQTTATS